MKHKKIIVLSCASILTAGTLVGCTSKEAAKPTDTPQNTGPLAVTIAVTQVGEIPAKGNEIEKAIEKYTNTKLDFQWIPSSAYDEKVNIMIASGEVPKILKVNYTPTTIASLQSGTFWEVGPYLKDYKNLSAQNPQYYENIKVDGKLYGIPLYREIARPAVIYRQDWMDALKLKAPLTLDDWYQVSKTIATGDPDQNGKNDTYGFVLDKKYNEASASGSVLTRIAVSQGGVNRWGVDNAGKFTPEFMTAPFIDTMKLFKRLYSEKLINQDFPAVDATETDKLFESGRVGVKINGVATNAANIQDRIVKVDPKAQLDITPWQGPNGGRVAAQSGNNGLLVFSKSSVKTEVELKQLLIFLDKMMDPEMSMLQKRGIEGVHYTKVDGGMVAWKDLTAFNKDVKPYRDSLLNFETYNVLPLKDTPLAMKGYKMEPDSLQFAVHNPALNLSSAIYSERGKELETMIQDAETKYIVGKLDDAGFQAEVEKWRKSGGDQLIKEYEAAYKTAKK
ncbi:extracellular solute-binding protein [Paenibacillus sp. TAB 01]|uniref:extracellular solute-binding protein n=1 Tax=Paenibacillus sp. TAB 01 TaxID=3368988 RepID=UPI0037508DEC